MHLLDSSLSVGLRAITRQSGVGLIQRYNPFKSRKSEAVSADKKRMSQPTDTELSSFFLENSALNVTGEVRRTRALEELWEAPAKGAERRESCGLARSRVVNLRNVKEMRVETTPIKDINEETTRESSLRKSFIQNLVSVCCW